MTRTDSITTCCTAGRTNHCRKVRSLVGLIPLFAVETLDSELVDQLPGFKHRMQWFIENRPDFGAHVERIA